MNVAPETIEVLLVARQISEWTQGKFDVTFAALSDLWKFDHDQGNSIPDRAAKERRLPLVNFEEVATDRAAGTAFIRKPGMRVHLGGIGKGYAVDRAAAMPSRNDCQPVLTLSGARCLVGPVALRGWATRTEERGPRLSRESCLLHLHLDAVLCTTFKSAIL